MDNIQKRKKQFFKQFLFRRVDSTPSISFIYFTIVLLNIICDGLVSFQYISMKGGLINLGAYTQFYIEVGLIAGFGFITLLSIFNNFFKYVWIYYVAFLQAITIFYVRTFGVCFNKDITTDVCKDSASIQIGHGILFLVFIFVMIIFRNNAYYPFQNSNRIFSMRQQNISLFLLIFRLVFGFQVVNLFSLQKDQQIKIILISGFLIFWRSRTSGYLHQLIKKIWDIYYYFIFWICLSCFIALYINLINDTINMAIFSEALTFKQSALYFFCYTFPILVTIPIMGGYGQQFWYKIFEVNDHNLQKVYSKQEVYLICNQLYQKIQNIKKSQMKYRDPEYKKLFKIIKKHNMCCTLANCSLNEIQNIKQQIYDDLHEQKRYLKILKCCIEFTKLNLQKLKQLYPDNRQVDIEIAYFYLFALKNKQKAMLLYNSLNTKKNKQNNKQKQNQYNYQQNSQVQLSNKKKINSKKYQILHLLKQNNFTQAYSVYYLKMKIDSIFVGQQKLTNSNADNQLSEFRQKIQVSVTMLAQFWSLLADPKCNLKKMYDLTNFLFPLKLNLQQDWQKVKLLKNIQIYSIYAKYLIRMFNDKQKGMKIYEQVQKLQLQLKNKEQVELDDKGQDIVDENGIIFLEFDGKNSGVMYQINVNAQKIFGYSKGELLNKKVNDLMPFIYAKQHDRILQNYQQTNYSTMMNKQRFVWGKSKDGFIFPSTILIKPVLNFYSQSSSSQVYANIRRQQCLRQIVGIIIDQNQIVQQFSSSALRLFPSLLQKYQATNKNMRSYIAKSDQQKKLKTLEMLTINELIPQYNQIKQKILYQNQQCQIAIQRIIKTGKNKQESYLQKCMYSISINQITIKIAGKLGFLIKLSKIRQSQFEKIKQASALNPNTTTNITIDCNLENQSRKQLNQGKNDLNRDNKVKFQLTQQDQATFMAVNKQKRNFIFSYDLADKIKDFQVSAKNIQDIRCSKKQPNNQSLSNLQQKRNQRAAKYIPGMTNANSLQTNTMKYIGGYTRSSQILQKFKNQTLNTFKAQLQISEQIYCQNCLDYASGIKTKRLYYNQIKQLRQQEIQLQFKNQLPQQLQQQQSNQLVGQIKHSQLTFILSQKHKNKNITYLRIVTIFLLITVSVLSIVEKIIFDNNFMNVYNKTINIKKIGQIKTEMYAIGFCVNYLTLFAGQDRITYQQLQKYVNQLDQELDNFIFSSDTNLVYSDGSSEQYYLGFALSKLISEANSLSLFTGLLPTNNSAIFFIKHNTLNSLSISLDTQISLISKNIDQSLNNTMKTYYIFFGAVTSFALLIIIIKNILLRIIIKKKTQILQVFFQIPRVSCSLLQKQCQLFILRLSTDNQEEDMEQEINDEQFQQMGKKNQKVQKKRTIVGQENTTFMFGIISIVLLIILVAFQMYIISISQINKSSTLTIITSSKQFLDIQYKLFQIITFMQSININRTIPVYNTTNFISILDKLQQQIKMQIENLRISFYDLLRIFDYQYKVGATSIYYENVCVQGTKCNGSIQQKNGLNSIITKYTQLIKQQYQLTIKYLLTQTPFPSPISKKTQQTIKLYQQLTKQNWRKLTKILLQSTLRYIEKNKTMNLWVLTAVCILNLVVLLIGWMRYYWNLEQKMVATQYILTFIPIDQINKNAKIGKYIKQEILNRK